MTKAGQGFLAIWSDIAAPDETDYLHWISREHAAERVALPGFRGVRIFRARLPQTARYFILYSLDGPEALASPEYLARLNGPTPWSSRIMPKLDGFERGGGRILAEHGWGNGGILAARKLAQEDIGGALKRLEHLAGADRRVAARLLEVDRARTDIPTREKSMRTAEGAFAGILTVEALDTESLADLLVPAEDASTRGETLIYHQVFEHLA